MLIKYGAKLDHRDRRYETALTRAIQRRDGALAWILLENGADPNSPVGCSGQSNVLNCAIENKDTFVIAHLIAKGAQVNAHGVLLTPALFLAARGGHKPSVQCLLENGADVNFEDSWGETALTCAIVNHKAQIAACLVGYGAHTDHLTRFNTSALSYVIKELGTNRASARPIAEALLRAHVAPTTEEHAQLQALLPSYSDIIASNLRLLQDALKSVEAILGSDVIHLIANYLILPS